MTLTQMMNSLIPSPVWEEPGEPVGATPTGAEIPVGDPPNPEVGDPKSLITDGEEPKQGEPTPHAFDTEVTAEGLVIPEFFEVSDDMMPGLLEAINGAENRTDLVNALMSRAGDLISTVHEQTAKAYTDLIDSWVNEVKGHENFGGENLKPALAKALTVAKEFGGDEFISLLDATGVGNNIHMVALLNKVYDALPQEARPVMGEPAPTGAKDIASRLYPNQS